MVDFVLYGHSPQPTGILNIVIGNTFRNGVSFHENMKLLAGHTIRRGFIADPGYSILSADYDQIELRIAAGMAGEEVLIEAAKRGESLHKTAAMALFGKDFTPDQYRYTKNVNFGWLYGGGASTLSKQAGITLKQASDILRQYGQQFPALTKFKKDETEKVIKLALSSRQYAYYKQLRERMFAYRANTSEGRVGIAAIRMLIDRLCYRKFAYVYTPYGRRLIVDANKAYAVVNYKVQSTARDIMAEGLLRVMDDPELEPTVLLPVHDELLGQALKSKAEYIARRYGEVMTTEFMGVPITAAGKVYGKSWGHGYIRK